MGMDADIDAILGAFGESAVFDGHTANVVVDLIDDRFLEQRGITAVRGEVRTIAFRTSSFPGLVVGSSISIGSTAYKVVDRWREDDGRISHALLGAA